MIRCNFVITLCLLFLLSIAAFGSNDSVVKSILPNGLTVLIKPEPGSGIVAVSAFVRAGMPHERIPLAGIGNLVARTLMTSTLNNSADRLAASLDEVGGNFQTIWWADFTELRAITTTANMEEAVRLIGEILTNADFPEKSLEEARKKVLDDLREVNDSIFDQAFSRMLASLYKDSPYKRSLAGDVYTVRKLTRADAIDFYKQYFVPNNTVLAIVGDIDSETAIQAAKIAFSGARRADLPKAPFIPDEKLDASESIVLQRDITAAYILIGYLSPGMNNPDFFAFTVLASLLGRGKASRLFSRIRDDYGIGYNIGALFPTRYYQGHLVLYLSVDAARFDASGFSGGGPGISDLKKMMLDQVNQIKTGDFSDKELERAKNYTSGDWLLRHQRASERAYFLGSHEVLNLGYEFDLQFANRIEAVKKEDVIRVANKYLNNYIAVIVLPDPSLRSQISDSH